VCNFGTAQDCATGHVGRHKAMPVQEGPRRTSNDTSTVGGGAQHDLGGAPIAIDAVRQRVRLVQRKGDLLPLGHRHRALHRLRDLRCRQAQDVAPPPDGSCTSLVSSSGTTTANPVMSAVQLGSSICSMAVLPLYSSQVGAFCAPPWRRRSPRRRSPCRRRRPPRPGS
jgi:hypothetical protein